ncbi:hypothetical protein B0H67DRAFT_580096 [Lasiosphaeris hirsuta]|uniref:Uncharacterized protein n=1 Tax=Lasiosphaeris hirsuta TaxID=260670 RepID=A0AA40AG23_9PEZI|nr:hypothetical protein B0H67DRAFT_580096 [Lasiosphaeris hirsuta]
MIEASGGGADQVLKLQAQTCVGFLQVSRHVHHERISRDFRAGRACVGSEKIALHVCHLLAIDGLSKLLPIAAELRPLRSQAEVVQKPSDASFLSRFSRDNDAWAGTKLVRPQAWGVVRDLAALARTRCHFSKAGRRGASPESHVLGFICNRHVSLVSLLCGFAAVLGRVLLVLVGRDTWIGAKIASLDTTTENSPIIMDGSVYLVRRGQRNSYYCGYWGSLPSDLDELTKCSGSK